MYYIGKYFLAFRQSILLDRTAWLSSHMHFTNYFKWNNSDFPKPLIDKNNTWISVKYLSRGCRLAGTLFKNVKYSACLYPINQWFLWKTFILKEWNSSQCPNQMYPLTCVGIHNLITCKRSRKRSLRMCRCADFKGTLQIANRAACDPKPGQKITGPLRPPVRSKTFHSKAEVKYL